MIRNGIQILFIVLVSGGLAWVVNGVHPRAIPWVQEWGDYVETKARNEGIEVIPLNMARSFHSEGSHLFVDARKEAVFLAGHVLNAVSLPFEELDSHFETLAQVLDADRPLVVYCTNRDCDEAFLLAVELRAMGQSNLLYYVEGFELWKEAGCPFE